MVSVQQTPLLTLLTAPIVAAYTAAGFWGDETIYHFAARHARTTPQAFAVRDRHRRLSYAELVEAADRLAAHLAGHGVRPGQRVAVWLPSRVETAVVLIACSSLLPLLASRPHSSGDRRAGRPHARHGNDCPAGLRCRCRSP